MDLLCSVEAALRVGPRAVGRWLLGGDLENLRCVTALATVGLPWLLVCLWRKQKHAAEKTACMLQKRQAEEAVDQRAEDAVDRTDEMNSRFLESISQSENMTRDCLLRHEASERLSWGMREQVRADEAEARVAELTAQLDRLENRMVKDGALHKSSSAAANGAVPVHVPVLRVDTFGAAIDVARISALPAHRRKVSPLSRGVPVVAASPLQIQRVDTFGESLETSSVAAERARGALAGGAGASGAAAAAGQGVTPTLQERLAMTRKASPLVRGVSSSPLVRSPLAGS